jgi:hypothetical protein
MKSNADLIVRANLDQSPNPLSALLASLGRAGIELAPHPTDEGCLRHRPAVLPPDLYERLKTHREAVLGLLMNGYDPDPEGDADYVLTERLGIADELGMPTHTGSPGWLIAVAESLGKTSCASATSLVNSVNGQSHGTDSSSDSRGRGDSILDCKGLRSQQVTDLADAEQQERPIRRFG